MRKKNKNQSSIYLSRLRYIIRIGSDMFIFPDNEGKVYFLKPISMICFVSIVIQIILGFLFVCLKVEGSFLYIGWCKLYMR